MRLIVKIFCLRVADSVVVLMNIETTMSQITKGH